MKHTRDHKANKIRDFRRSDATRGKSNRGHVALRPIPAHSSRSAIQMWIESFWEDFGEMLLESYDESDSLSFNAQCYSGHVFSIPEWSDLENRARSRIERGIIDAIVVGPDECPTCIKQRQKQERESAYLLDESDLRGYSAA